jgi:hypothetical protein
MTRFDSAMDPDRGIKTGDGLMMTSVCFRLSAQFFAGSLKDKEALPVSMMNCNCRLNSIHKMDSSNVMDSMSSRSEETSEISIPKQEGEKAIQ